MIMSQNSNAAADQSRPQHMGYGAPSLPAPYQTSNPNNFALDELVNQSQKQAISQSLKMRSMKKNKFQRPKKTIKVLGPSTANEGHQEKDDDDMVVHQESGSESNICHRMATNTNSADGDAQNKEL